MGLLSQEQMRDFIAMNHLRTPEDVQAPSRACSPIRCRRGWARSWTRPSAAPNTPRVQADRQSQK